MRSRLISICSDISTSTTDTDDGIAPKTFAFDNELFLGPVYKRLLVAKLCENDKSHTRSKELSGRMSFSPETSGPNNSDAHEQEMLETVLEEYATTMWEQRVFSRSCTEDLLEFLERHRPRKLSRRHLPLAVATRRRDLKPDEQDGLDRALFEAVHRREPEQVARALDDGANINARLDGSTALQVCVLDWYKERAQQPELPHVSTTIAEYLLLYHETQITYNFGGVCNILHLCMHTGGSALLRQVLPSINGLLEKDTFGRNPLQTAALCGDISLGCIKTLRGMFSEYSLDPYRTLNKIGQDAQMFAAKKGAMKHAEQFQRLAAGEHRADEEYHQRLAAHEAVEHIQEVGPSSQRGPVGFTMWVTNPDLLESDVERGTAE
jgi:hypothetical protein